MLQPRSKGLAVDTQRIILGFPKWKQQQNWELRWGNAWGHANVVEMVTEGIWKHKDLDV